MPDIFISPKSTAETSKPPKDKLLEKVNSLDKKKSAGKLDQALSPYLFMPKGMRFETQGDEEEIVLILRKHWVTNFVWLATSVLFILIPLIGFPGIYVAGLIPSSIPNSFITLLIFIWYLFIFSYALMSFLLWYFTVSIVTNERVVDIDFVNILHKKFAATRIARVEDVTMKRGGILKAIFDYGDVIVQTAAREAEFQFYSVPHPERVVRILNNLMGKEEDEH